MDDIRKRQFLKALKEPVQSSFALLDFAMLPFTEVIHRALNVDHQNIGSGLTLIQGLAESSSQPTPEETQLTQSHALLDSGASTCFVIIAFSRAHKIPTVRIQPLPVKAIDRRVPSLGAVMEAILPLALEIGSHKEKITFFLIASPPHPVILGLS